MPVSELSLSTVTDADAYFGSRLYSEVWIAATSDRKQAALNDATRLINRFRYIGTKTEDTQPYEWPREGISLDSVAIDSASIPQDILLAQYEIAFALLSGVNIEKELRSAGVTSRGYSSVRITYDPGSTAVWLLLGIPSYAAWAYLLPYLYRETDGSIKLHRV